MTPAHTCYYSGTSQPVVELDRPSSQGSPMGMWPRKHVVSGATAAALQMWLLPCADSAGGWQGPQTLWGFFVVFFCFVFRRKPKVNAHIQLITPAQKSLLKTNRPTL